MTKVKIRVDGALGVVATDGGKLTVTIKGHPGSEEKVRRYYEAVLPSNIPKEPGIDQFDVEQQNGFDNEDQFIRRTMTLKANLEGADVEVLWKTLEREED